MLETGSAVSTNAQNILMKVMLDLLIAALVFWVCGYAIAYGASAGGLIGVTGFFLGSADVNYGVWFTQWTFLCNTVTIFAGSVAYRTRFMAYCSITVLVSGLIFPLACHWCWNEAGWLHNLGSNGFQDFSGSGVVHMLGGVVGFVACRRIGPRIGRYNDDGSVNAMEGHNKPLATLGVFMLWFGW